MKQLLFSLFAIALAGFAAMAATTLFLNTPTRVDPATVPTVLNQAPTPPAGEPAAAKPAAPSAAKPATPGAAPDAKAPAGAPAADTADDEGPDKDPYEGIAPEELPPDLQYNADSSVSFPTNI